MDFFLVVVLLLDVLLPHQSSLTLDTSKSKKVMTMLLNVLLPQNSSPILDTSKNKKVITVVPFSTQKYLPSVIKHYNHYFKQRKQSFVL